MGSSQKQRIACLDHNGTIVLLSAASNSFLSLSLGVGWSAEQLALGPGLSHECAAIDITTGFLRILPWVCTTGGLHLWGQMHYLHVGWRWKNVSQASYFCHSCCKYIFSHYSFTNVCKMKYSVEQVLSKLFTTVQPNRTTSNKCIW